MINSSKLSSICYCQNQIVLITLIDED